MAYDDDQPMPTPQQLAEHQQQISRAHQVGCSYCGAKPNQPCLNKAWNNAPIEHFTHWVRQKDAARAELELPF